LVVDRREDSLTVCLESFSANELGALVELWPTSCREQLPGDVPRFVEEVRVEGYNRLK
jgi:hypothetical protein